MTDIFNRTLSAAAAITLAIGMWGATLDPVAAGSPSQGVFMVAPAIA